MILVDEMLVEGFAVLPRSGNDIRYGYLFGGLVLGKRHERFCDERHGVHRAHDDLLVRGARFFR